jgi:hypothetical protein
MLFHLALGEIRAEPEGLVLLGTALGGSRIVDILVGDPPLGSVSESRSYPARRARRPGLCGEGAALCHG